MLISIDSKYSKLIKFVDLFTSSINRVVNHQGANKNAKQMQKIFFAEHVLTSINLIEEKIEVDKLEDEEITKEVKNDMSTLYNFD